ncbi:methylamine utilization protein MauE [Flavobacterium succinicans]|uniref:Methylamine utilization protein MauE n=2 Tax=Flavobacterium succinicans TaxID=29536 RepID=A0A199XUC8_9FLAO|nr:methylamine utilization protein MauE [Flavobacterium succinicans]
MELSVKIKEGILGLVSVLFILLFTYAAISKLLDFENFQIQLAQSPIVSVWAIWFSFLIPLIELGIVVLFLVPKYKPIAFYSSLIVMSLFTAYIFIILRYSAYIPCSCGGILDKMSWETHLVFNLVFVLFAVLAIFLSDTALKPRRKVLLGIKMVLVVTGSGILMLLFFWHSTYKLNNENPFIRRYLQHPIELVKQINLGYNSYYFAGSAANTIYLGNYSNPLHVEALDTTLQTRKSSKITFESKGIPFKMVTLKVAETNFYLTDGSVPKIFKGNISDWKITEELHQVPFFNQLAILDPTVIGLRANLGKNAAHVLGTYTRDAANKTTFNDKLVQPQLDGVFDTDGILLASTKLQQFVYLYYYRNTITVFSKEGRLSYRSTTIDTIKKAQIKVSYLKEGAVRKMSAPPLIVNAQAALCESLLFVQSKIRGRLENGEIWKQASIIDVYDVAKKTYLFSFPIYSSEKTRLDAFYVTNTHLFTIMGNQLRVYRFREWLKNAFKETST